MTFTREITFTAGWDNRDVLRNPSKPFGSAHGVTVWFCLRSDENEGVNVFGFATGWLPTHVDGVIAEVPDADLPAAVPHVDLAALKFHPTGWDLGWHRPLTAQDKVEPVVMPHVGDPAMDAAADHLNERFDVEVVEGAGVVGRACPFLGGRDCVHDGSGVDAGSLLRRLITDGSEAVWAFLEAEYQGRLDEADELAAGWLAGVRDRLGDVAPQVVRGEGAELLQGATVGASDVWRAGYLVGYREAPELPQDEATYHLMAPSTDEAPDDFAARVAGGARVTTDRAGVRWAEPVEDDPTGLPVPVPVPTESEVSRPSSDAGEHEQ